MVNDLTIKGIIESAYETAKEKGWWNPAKSPGELIALIHSEVSEALEEIRIDGYDLREIYHEEQKDKDGKYTGNFKPMGFPSELADVVIRICDLCGHYGIDLEDAIRQKLIYNRTRPYRHGGKKL